MIHNVIENVDRGEVIRSVKVSIKNDDTIDTLNDRIKSYERVLLLEFYRNL